MVLSGMLKAICIPSRLLTVVAAYLFVSVESFHTVCLSRRLPPNLIPLPPLLFAWVHQYFLVSFSTTLIYFFIVTITFLSAVSSVSYRKSFQLLLQ
jgi:hypothetical protein